MQNITAFHLVKMQFIKIAIWKMSQLYNNKEIKNAHIAPCKSIIKTNKENQKFSLINTKILIPEDSFVDLIGECSNR